MSTMSIDHAERDPAAAERQMVAEGVVRLRPLLAAAGSTEFAAREGWTALLGATHQVTRELVASGELPVHLMVGSDDPPVLATRTIAAAWKHVTRTPSRSDVPGTVGRAASLGQRVLARTGGGF